MMSVIVQGDLHIYLSSDKEGKVDVKSIRRDPQLKSVKEEVKARDIHCQCCGEMDKPLQVHHIAPVSVYPELAYDPNNCVCLCQKCHDRYHKEFKDNENSVTFAEFMRRYGKRGLMGV